MNSSTSRSFSAIPRVTCSRLLLILWLLFLAGLGIYAGTW
jgi:hypothetical protein